MLEITSNIGEFLKGLGESEKSVGFARTVALTRTARATSEFLGQEILRVFDRPTPFTQRAVTWLWATADKQAVDVFIRTFAGKGVPASKYLYAEIMGGARRQKRSEVALQRLMGNRGFWVPGPGLTLDAYGNVPGSSIRRMLSDLQVAGEQNTKAAGKRRNKRLGRDIFFVPKPGSKLAPGVWLRRANGSIAPALFFVTHANYKQRFDFFGKGTRFAVERYPLELDRSICEGWNLPRSVQKSLGLSGRI
jgi:hypothetical protein